MTRGMTDLSALLRPDKGQPATSLHLVDKKGFEAWLKGQPARIRKAAAAQGFQGRRLSSSPSSRASATTGRPRSASPMSTSSAPGASPRRRRACPKGTYRVAGRSPGPAVLGWLLGQYRFERYKQGQGQARARASCSPTSRRGSTRPCCSPKATFLVRDLVNIPAGDLGPAELEAAARALADECGAKVTRHRAARRWTRAIRWSPRSAARPRRRARRG